MVGRNISDNKPEPVQLLTPSVEELNLLDAESVNNFIEVNEPDAIIHAAGVVGGIQANMKYPVKFLSYNTRMADNLINSANKYNTPRFINLSQFCMYL